MRPFLPVLVLLLAPVLLHGQAVAPAPAGAIAIPLAEPPPAWYTPEVHAAVLAAAESGLAYDLAAGVAVPLPPLLKIQPGATMMSPQYCALAFVFGAPGSYEIATSGQCGLPGDMVIIRFSGSTPLLSAIGRISASRDAGLGADWALIDVFTTQQARVSPCAAIIMGPDGAWGGSSQPTPIKWVTEDGLEPGAGFHLAQSGGAFFGIGPAYGSLAGAPVITATTSPQGEAVGMLTHVLLGSAATLAGTRLASLPVSGLATCP